MNAWHEHFNVSGTEPARYVAMTSAPRVIDTFDNYKFVFENPFVFEDRFNSEEGYFRETGRKADQRRWHTNFVADVMACQMAEGGRGIGVNIGLWLVNGTMKSHSSFWPVGTYKKAHRHGPGIHVVILKDHGYSLMWQEGKSIERIDWEPGSVFVPPEMWFHQHFNTGKDPVLFLAIGWGSDKPKAAESNMSIRVLRRVATRLSMKKKIRDSSRLRGCSCLSGRKLQDGRQTSVLYRQSLKTAEEDFHGTA